MVDVPSRPHASTDVVEDNDNGDSRIGFSLSTCMPDEKIVWLMEAEESVMLEMPASRKEERDSRDHMVQLQGTSTRA